MLKVDLFIYEEEFNHAMLKHTDLETRLLEYPDWILQYHLGSRCDSYTAQAIEMEGIEALNYDTGEPLSLIEWMREGYYNVYYTDNTPVLFNDYIDYLKSYSNIVNHLIFNIDYIVEPIAVKTISTTAALYIFDVIHAMEDMVAVGPSFWGSELYPLRYEDGETAYFKIGDSKYYLNDFMRLS